MTSTDLMTGARSFRTLLIDHNNMAPTIRRDSVVFLHEPGLQGEGIYSFGDADLHSADLRRVSSVGTGAILSMDNWPGEPQQLTFERLKECEPRLVAGVASPFSREFIDFLRFRFREVVS